MEGVSIMRTILAVGHPQIHQALKSFPELEIVGEVFDRKELLMCYQQGMPEVVIASEMLKGKELGDLTPFLIEIKRVNPSVRMIYLAGQLDENNPNHRTKVQNLAHYQIYDLYTEKELSLKQLRELILYPKTIEAVKQWLLSESPVAEEGRGTLPTFEGDVQRDEEIDELRTFSKRKQFGSTTESPVSLDAQPTSFNDSSLSMDPPFGSRPPLSSSIEESPFVSLERHIKKKPTRQIRKIDGKRVFHTTISLTMILVGFWTIYSGLKPLWSLKTQTAASVLEWEQAKQEFLESGRDQLEIEHYQESIQEVVSSESSSDTSIFGLIQLANEEKRLGLRAGTSDEILDKGAGFDPSMAIPGKPGNAVIYGHREEVFWKLKDLKAGDMIRIETLEGDLRFKVTRTFVTEPGSEEIYQDSEQSMITLVTCYPFVYMGPTPERFVVVAELVEE